MFTLYETFVIASESGYAQESDANRARGGAYWLVFVLERRAKQRKCSVLPGKQFCYTSYQHC